jgi:hypothetical protein
VNGTHLLEEAFSWQDAFRKGGTMKAAVDRSQKTEFRIQDSEDRTSNPKL